MDGAVTDILSDLGLPKFSDRKIQNTVQFLSDSYFLVRSVADSNSLHRSKKAVAKHKVIYEYYTFSVQLCDNIQYSVFQKDLNDLNLVYFTY